MLSIAGWSAVSPRKEWRKRVGPSLERAALHFHLSRTILSGGNLFCSQSAWRALGVAFLKAFERSLFRPQIKKADAHLADVPEKLLRLSGEIGAESVPIRYFESEEPFAFTAGLFRTAIHLSSALVDSLDDAQLKGVIAHEYAHVVRRDNLAIFAALALRDFLFIFPLSHLLLGIYMRRRNLPRMTWPFS